MILCLLRHRGGQPHPPHEGAPDHRQRVHPPPGRAWQRHCWYPPLWSVGVLWWPWVLGVLRVLGVLGVLEVLGVLKVPLVQGVPRMAGAAWAPRGACVGRVP